MKSGAKLWIKRLSGLSIILILVFIGTYGESTDKIVQIMNVEENNLLELESGEEDAIQLEKIRFYTVVTLEGNEIKEYEVKLIDQDGQEISGYEPSSIEKMNKRPDSSGKLVFIPVIIFEVPSDGEYVFHNQGNNSLWVLDDIEIQSSLISDQIILVSMFSCCLGFPLGIIALIGWLVVWRTKNKSPQKLIINEQIMTTDQLFKQYNAKSEKSMIENDEVPAPFRDIEKVTVTINELSLDDDDPDITKEKVRQFLEEHVGSEENDDDKESDGNWKNWDDGE
tara:strand:- start:2347 stop:3189 length:843 start_codon:yes stop_codon:yes gene_type:complete